MKSKRLLSIVPLVLLSGIAIANAQSDSGAVFAMTNAATGNQIMAYARTQSGELVKAGTYWTGGNGTGGGVDPLTSQGSLVLSGDHQFLFVVNAASATVSEFTVNGAELSLRDTQPSGGQTPTSLAQSGRLLYVLNTGGNGALKGFRIDPTGHLQPIAHSTRSLSGPGSGATSIAFSPYGQYLVVTEKLTGKIDVFAVAQDGTLSPIAVNPSLDANPFAAAFTWDGSLIVASASNFVSSYAIQPDLSLKPVTASLPTLGAATCWNVVAPNNRFAYTSDAGSGTISGFSVAAGGVLTALPGTLVGTNPGGSANLDVAVNASGRDLYTLDAGTGSISDFTVESNGSLAGPVTIGGLPASAGIQGIAAY